MGRIDRDTVQKILDTADIVDVVSDFVKLRRSGANFKGLCPFHNERTPSFSVNKARNYCKCFSCGKGGSPVGFIMEHEQMNYNEALRYLARKYNIEIIERDLSDEERQVNSDREAMMAVNEFALNHFEHNLTQTQEGVATALAYLRHRGISDAMIKRFRLGYAIDAPTEFHDAAVNAGFRDKYLVSTGLNIEAERNGKTSIYDRFRSRVIFPVFTVSGRPIAFGGRTMRSDKNIAKYVNSPESEIYHKSNELYGLFQAKTAIAKRDKCILVEGYLDVISMHQAGVENVVASSGTSLTEGQIRAIRRFSSNVTLIYDADPAGIKASLRGINLLLAEDIDVKVLLLPPGDDPDSFAQSHTSDQVEAYLAEHETDIIAFMTDVLFKDVPANDPMGRAKVVNVILQSVACVDDPIKRQEYISQCSRLMNIPEETIARQLEIFVTKRLEDAEKNSWRTRAEKSIDDLIDEKNNTSESDEVSKESSENTKSSVQETEPTILTDNILRPAERMLVRYLVRFGLVHMADVIDESGNTIPATVADIIRMEMELDNLEFTIPEYKELEEEIFALRPMWINERATVEQRINNECANQLSEAINKIRREGQNVEQMEQAEKDARENIERDRIRRLREFDMLYTQNQLLSSHNERIRRLATSLATDRYTLSRIFANQDSYIAEEDQLDKYVPRAINELRAAFLTSELNKIRARLSSISADNISELEDTMARFKELTQKQKELSKILGERIILPK